jgi:hypothetical protein
MKATRFALLRRRGRPGRFGSVALSSLALAGLVWFSAAATATAEDSTNAPAPAAPPAAAPDKKSAAPKRKISGVELYAIHCNRCHPERYPVEFNQSQWKTLMLHMRVRANLPADQARALMLYLQDVAGI